MHAIADNGRFILADADGRLLFIERRGLIPAWLIFAVNGCLLAGLGLLGGDGRLPAGLGMIAAAAGSGWTCVTLIRRRSARNETALDPAEAIVVLDLAAGVLRDAAGEELAPLGQVRFVRRFQATSSSRALHVVWPRGEQVVYRGDPFSGSVEDAVGALERRGVAVG